jgi:hypothetical protein
MCGTILPFSNIPAFNDRPWLLYIWCSIVALLPSVLEWTGVLSATMVVGTADHFELRSAIFAHNPRVGMIALTFGNVLLLLAVARLAIAIGRDRRDVQQKLTNQAWHLRKLLP